MLQINYHTPETYEMSCYLTFTVNPTISEEKKRNDNFFFLNEQSHQSTYKQFP